MWQAITAVTNRPDEFRPIAVGFVDLTGFTRLSRELDEQSLASLIHRFESASYNAVVGGGGRVVKMIGDEVMFVADDPETAVRIALALIETTRNDDELPLARAGVAWGTALLRLGDCHGPAVNLASRMAEVAPSGTVLACEELRTMLWHSAPLAWRPRGTRRLKGIGRVPLWEVGLLRDAASDAKARNQSQVV